MLQNHLLESNLLFDQDPFCPADYFETKRRMASIFFVTGGVTSSREGDYRRVLAKLLRGDCGLRFRNSTLLVMGSGNVEPLRTRGECYVTEDGAETDLDLGHYERFLNIFTSRANNVTTGRILPDRNQQRTEGAYREKQSR